MTWLLVLQVLVAVPAPGATNPAITARTQAQTICAPSGWTTKVIRPPTSYTTRLKRQQLDALGYTVWNPLPSVPTKSGRSVRPDIRYCIPRSANVACYELDHQIPLTLGGHPSDVRNLWPQPIAEALQKDRLEQTLHRRVCAGQVSLTEAQRAISTDWRSAYRRFLGTDPKVGLR
jgi:hypothetical protein